MIQLLLILFALLLVAIKLALIALAILLGAMLAAWWIPLAVAMLLVSALGWLLLVLVKPSLIAIFGGGFLVAASATGTVVFVGGLLAEGVVHAGHIEADLRELMARGRATQVADLDGRPIGIFSGAYNSDQADVPYLTVPIGPDEVPPIFWACTKYLEDRGIGEPWHVMGVDFYRLVRAVLSNFVGDRKGASTLAEMVQRTIRNRTPDPRLGWRTELARKIASWRELPAIMLRVFPDEQSLKVAAATYLTLLAGAPQSHFGGEVHGLVLAARVFGKRPDELSIAEQALLAAAIKRPLLVGGAPGKSWQRAKQRADYCLAHAPFGDNFNRAAARHALAALQAPAGTLRHPAAAVQDRLGGRTNAVVREVRQAIGSDWWRRTARIRIALRVPSPRLVADLKAVAVKVEAQHAQRLWLPIWSGDDAARIYGIVVDSSGEIFAMASNADQDLAHAKLPIGSVGKIVAALTLGTIDAPSSAARVAFARSHSPSIAWRLRRVPVDRIAQAFEALGWHPASGARISRRHALYGAIEVTPADVLRGLMALNALLWSDRAHPTAIASLVREIETIDGVRLIPPAVTLPIEPLERLISDPVRTYVRAVLGAPLRTGTMREVGKALAAAGASDAWAKSGTADVESGGFNVSPTRALWHVGGFSIEGRRLTFVLVVASPTGSKPLGFVQSPAIAPLTIVLLRHAIAQVRAKED